jgi:hypothetical protein
MKPRKARIEAALKDFARNLFAEEVHEVVRGRRIVHQRLQQAVAAEFSLPGADWIRLGAVLEEAAQLHEQDRLTEIWNDFLDLHGLRRPDLAGDPGQPLGPFLGAALCREPGNPPGGRRARPGRASRISAN